MIRPIQYLRGLAAMMVVWQHSAGQVTGMFRLIPMTDIGSFGVHLFFVISGFIMLLTTSEREVTPGQFLRQRLIRVAPLYWLATLGMVGCFFVAPGLFKYLKFTPDALAQSLAFIPYWSLAYPGSIYPLLLPGWTLNYEMFFYALFAGVLFLPGRHRLVGLTMVLGLLVIAGYVFHPVSAISIIYTSPRLLEFAAGALLAHLWRAGQLQMRFEVAAAVLLLAACSVLVHGWAGTPEWTGSPAGDWIEMGLATCIVGACLHPTIVKTQNVTLGALGDASYSIYLTHLFTLGAMRVVWSHFVHTATVGSSIAWMAVSLVGCALAGWICFLGIERPITNGLKRWHPWARAKETYQRITVIREGN